MSGGHEVRKHGKFSPSASERFFRCPGSVNLLERVPARQSSPYAIEGTKGHEVLEAALKNKCRRAIQAHREFTTPPLQHEDFESGFYVSVQIALNYVWEILDTYPDAIMHTEGKVSVPTTNAPGEADGHCDIFIVIPSVKMLYVIDYKHGAGIAKDVEDNTQVFQYALGVLYGNFNGGVPLVEWYDIENVVCVILQPRAFHVDGYIREKFLTPYEIYEYLEVLDNQIAKCLEPDAPLIPGIEQCRFCDAATVCPARERSAFQGAIATYRNINDIRAPNLPDVKNLDVHRLAHIYASKEMLQNFIKSVDTHIIELLRQGVDVPGVKLVEAQARREWYGNEDDTAFKLAALIGCNVLDVIHTEVIGITEAEKLVIQAFKQRVDKSRKKAAAEDAKQAFAYLTHKKSSGNLTLAGSDDPRPAVNAAAATFLQIGDALQPPQMADSE